MIPPATRKPPTGSLLLLIVALAGLGLGQSVPMLAASDSQWLAISNIAILLTLLVSTVTNYMAIWRQARAAAAADKAAKAAADAAAAAEKAATATEEASDKAVEVAKVAAIKVEEVKQEAARVAEEAATQRAIAAQKLDDLAKAAVLSAEKVEEIRHATNSMKDQLVAAAHLQGQNEGAATEKAKQEVKQS